MKKGFILRKKIEYFLALLLIKISKILPVKFTYFLFDKIAVLLHFVLKSRKKLAYKNLSFAYQNLSQIEIKNLVLQNFKSLARTLADILLFYNEKLNLNDLIINKNEAVKKVKELTKNNKNGVIFFTAHFGNWEFLAHFFAMHNFPTSIVGRRGNNELIDEKIVLPFREKYGNTLIYKDDAMIKMVKALKNGGNIGILPDQKPGFKNSLKTTFFGRECYTTKSIASLYLKFNPVLIPMFAKRLENGKYEIIVCDFPKIPQNLDKNEAELFITQTCNDIFEDVVKTAPTQWFWMHNRWKID